MGLAEPNQGLMLSTVLYSQTAKDGTDASSAGTSRHHLGNLDLSEGPEYLHMKICDMPKTHSSTLDGTLVVIPATEHDIVTHQHALPTRAQPYLTRSLKRQIISNQTNRMLKPNVIAPSHRARATPVVEVPKQNDKSRFCVDYRRLNNITKKDAHHLHQMGDYVDSLADAQVFTSLEYTTRK